MPYHTTYVAGVKFRPGARERLAGIEEGTFLDLEPEPTNRFDPHAVMVLHDRFHVGYVPKDLAPEVGDLIAAGRCQGAEFKGGARIHIHYAKEAPDHGSD